MATIASKRLILHFKDGNLKTAFAASRDGNKCRNIMGQEFTVGEIIFDRPLNAENERDASTMIRGFQRLRGGEKMTAAQKRAWETVCCDPKELLTKARKGEKG